MSNDDAIRATNDDAASCKRFAVEKNYWKDAYIHYFIHNIDRKAPEINRGYFARVSGIETLLKEFLKRTQCQCQIVNLGSGFDTFFWRLKDENMSPKILVDVDFRQVVLKKCNIIRRNKVLLDKLKNNDNTDVTFSDGGLHSPNYHVIVQDLRDLAGFENHLIQCGIDFSVPTLFICECFLVYMPIESSEKLLKWIAGKFSTAVLINYEQANMNDHFGHIMIDNLKGRGCTLPGVSACESLTSQESRFLSTGWSTAKAWNMQTVYHSLSKLDIERIEKLEFLDEHELLDQLLDHYCICLATKETNGLDFSSISLPVLT